MRRLCDVEKYLLDRLVSSRLRSSQLYYELEGSDSFLVKFFDLSREMQEIRHEIVASAEERKRAKLAELHGLKTEYNRLMALSDRMECEYKDVLVDSINNFYEQQHKWNCQKCRYANDAENLKIHLHEWPLPQSCTKAKTIIFELCIPSYLQSWREATFYLLLDVIGMRYSNKSFP
ncbi:hypothetical protein F4677DRAFT_438635 [Hypoxylon crocopeplum]|nr:hypothetical protein F4677DRAFT_438635 [Hypoxylon crocopeplum]